MQLDGLRSFGHVSRRTRSALLLSAVAAVLLYFSSTGYRERGVQKTAHQEPPPGQGTHGTAHETVTGGAASDVPRALVDTAIVTFVMGDQHARLAVANMQSLRRHGTRVPHLVVLVGASVKGGVECEARRAQEDLPNSHCTREGAPVEDLLSNTYLRALRAMGVEVHFMEHVPRTPFSSNIAGGLYDFWGAAFNKLSILKMTRFRKVVWMDSDTVALQNLDHLLVDSVTGRDAFTAAFTVNCCAGVRGKVGGSLWVFEPSLHLYEQVWNMSNSPCPVAADPVGRTWHEGDQQVLQHVITVPRWERVAPIELWPYLEDYRQGVVPGLRYLIPFVNKSDEAIMEHLNWDIGRRFPGSVYGAGGAVFPDFQFNLSSMQGLLPRKYWPDDPPPGTPIWHALDARYDIMVGSCECKASWDLAGRVEQDAVGVQMTAHFSCIQPPLRKPSAYASEDAFMSAMFKLASSCHRWYFLLWYDLYKEAMSAPGVTEEGDNPGLPLPAYDGPPVPRIDVAHDAQQREAVKAGRRRLQALCTEEEREIGPVEDAPLPPCWKLAFGA